MKGAFLFVSVMILGLSQIAFAQATPTDTAIPKGYMVGPGDEITGKVLGEPQFDFVATVDEDGKIAVGFVEAHHCPASEAVALAIAASRAALAAETRSAFAIVGSIHWA